MGVHDGHRARMKARFVRNGLDNFDDHSVLELLLFYAVPRRDVNELAHALLDHFGTLDAVFEASCEDMMRVPGVGENVATLLTLIPQVGRRYQMAKRRQQTILRSSAEAGQYLVPLYLYERAEVVGKHHSIFVPPEERASLAYQGFWRDLRSYRITEGPTEVLRTTLARQILKRFA